MEKTVEKEMSDYEFSSYLDRIDKKWKYIRVDSVPPYTIFTDRHGKFLATVVYNNQKSTRKIFVPI